MNWIYKKEEKNKAVKFLKNNGFVAFENLLSDRIINKLIYSIGNSTKLGKIKKPNKSSL